MALLPPPDLGTAYVDSANRPSKDFFNWIKSIYQAVVANIAAIAAINAAWTAWTPTITASTGTITTKSAVARFKQIGKTVFFSADITITNAGSGTDFLVITVPVAERPTPPGFEFFGGGEVTGSAFGFIDTGHIFILSLDGSSPIVAGATITITGFYEAA